MHNFQSILSDLELLASVVAGAASVGRRGGALLEPPPAKQGLGAELDCSLVVALLAGDEGLEAGAGASREPAMAAVGVPHVGVRAWRRPQIAASKSRTRERRKMER